MRASKRRDARNAHLRSITMRSRSSDSTLCSAFVLVRPSVAISTPQEAWGVVRRVCGLPLAQLTCSAQFLARTAPLGNIVTRCSSSVPLCDTASLPAAAVGALATASLHSAQSPAALTCHQRLATHLPTAPPCLECCTARQRAVRGSTSVEVALQGSGGRKASRRLRLRWVLRSSAIWVAPFSRLKSVRRCLVTPRSGCSQQQRRSKLQPLNQPRSAPAAGMGLLRQPNPG